MTTSSPFTCLHHCRCKHWNFDLQSPPEGDWHATCAAFPNGIPREILTGDRHHTTPFPGDNGIQYEPVIKPATTPQSVDEVIEEIEGEETRGVNATERGDAAEPDLSDLMTDQAIALSAQTVEGWLETIRTWLQERYAEGLTLEQAGDRIAELYDQLDDRPYAEALRQTMNLSHLAGQDEVNEEIADEEGRGVNATERSDAKLRSPRDRGLVKQVITNRNGDRQTVWVRPDEVESSKGKRRSGGKGALIAGIAGTAIVGGALAAAALKREPQQSNTPSPPVIPPVRKPNGTATAAGIVTSGVVGAGIIAISQKDQLTTVAALKRHTVIPDLETDAELQTFNGMNPDGSAMSEELAQSIRSANAELYAELRKDTRPWYLSKRREQAFIFNPKTGEKSQRIQGGEISVILNPELMPGYEPPETIKFEPGEPVKGSFKSKQPSLGFTHSHPTSASLSFADMWTSPEPHVLGWPAFGYTIRQSQKVDFAIAVDPYGNVYNGILQPDAAKKRSPRFNPKDSESILAENAVLGLIEKFKTSKNPKTRELAKALTKATKIKEGNDIFNFCWTHAQNLMLQEMGVIHYQAQLTPTFQRIEEDFSWLFDAAREEGRKNRSSSNRTDAAEVLPTMASNPSLLIILSLDTFLSPYSSIDEIKHRQHQVEELPDGPQKQIVLAQIENLLNRQSLEEDGDRLDSLIEECMEWAFEQTSRLDSDGVECGKGWISKGEECHVGKQQQKKPKMPAAWQQKMREQKQIIASGFVRQEEFAKLQRSPRDHHPGINESFFVVAPNGQEFLFKTGEESNRRSNASYRVDYAAEVLASDMGIRAGVPVNRTRLVPAPLTSSFKQPGLAGTLHNVVPGRPYVELEGKPLPIGHQFPGRGSYPKAFYPDLDLQEFSQSAFTSALQHPDLTKIYALDVITGNPDRHSGNLLYDASGHRFYGIDMGLAFMTPPEGLLDDLEVMERSRSLELMMEDEDMARNIALFHDTLTRLKDQGPDSSRAFRLLTYSKAVSSVPMWKDDPDLMDRVVKREGIIKDTYKITDKIIKILDSKLKP